MSKIADIALQGVLIIITVFILRFVVKCLTRLLSLPPDETFEIWVFSCIAFFIVRMAWIET